MNVNPPMEGVTKPVETIQAATVVGAVLDTHYTQMIECVMVRYK